MMDQLDLILRAEVIWCLSGGAKVYAEVNGKPRPVMLRDLVRSYMPENVRLWNGEKWTQVLGWNRSADTDGALEFELRSGERIGCTPGHRWPTHRGLLRSDEVQVGDVIDVKVLKFDPASGKIALGRKQLLAKPWDSVDAKFPVNSIQKGKVTSLTDFGAFVELAPGVEGLVHQSEFSWKERGVKPKELLTVGQEVYVFILSINKEQEKMALSLKRAGENPWVEAAREYPAGSRVKGVVTHMLPVGAFVRLPSGIEGLLRTQDMSWTKAPAHPKDLLTVGQEIEAVVIDVNPTTEKMALGLKQLTEDPIAKFAPGATVEGKVVRLTDQGAFLELAPDIEGFVHISEIPSDHRLNHAGEVLKEGETVTGLVLKGQRKSRRIELSIRKHDQREERQLLKRYRPSGEGVTLGDVTEWGSADESAAGEPPASDSPTPNA
jgi:small subunit ribosomal protein S1